jgi:5-methylcytosine-specific restriction endonuclease McrA
VRTSEENVRHVAEWRKRNPEKVRVLRRAQRRRWRERYPAKNREQTMRYRARKLGLFVEAVDPQVVFERDEGICGICGEAVDHEKYHIDHIVALARGGEHSYKNVQLAHPSCNCAKRDT